MTEIAQGGLDRGSDVIFAHPDLHRAAVRVDRLAVADLALHPTEPWVPAASRRMPNSGSSAISTSAIRLLVVASHHENSMPAVCGRRRQCDRSMISYTNLERERQVCTE
jgi:hypothetical protein